uniref:Uncharacterized protein n=1 Tax=Tanacetum cinerariifolium TaxID=118510 RepID=A0A6L2JPW8_TANCI|nr:hypothetical protein [Tanacetum cinerariifolium]
MDLDELQSDLLALRRLYGLLINDEQYVEDASTGNLDKNARQLLLNLLNVAADKAFEAHAKMLGTQYMTSYNPCSMPQEQSSDGQNPQPLSPSNAPTDFPSLQQVDYLTGESIFSDPTNQAVFRGQTNSISNNEYNIRLKRCRVCQKPKVKQLTKEMSIQDRNVLTLNNISQQQRSWEVQNDPSSVIDSALSFDYVKSLALINLTDEEDQISIEASTKILQIESCISSLQAAVKHVNLVDIDYESQPSQMGQIGNVVVGRSDPINSRRGRGTCNSSNELTLQSQPFDTRTAYTMSPGSQTTSQAAENVGRKNQHNHMPEETYDYFHSGGATSNTNTNRPLYREQMDRKHMDKKEVMGSEIIQWLNPTDRMTTHRRHDYEYQEAEFKREKRAGKMYKDKMNHYKEIYRKHEIVKPISMVSPSSQSLSDSPISSSDYDTISQSEIESQSESQLGSTSSDSEGSSSEVYSRSSGSGADEESESEMYSLSSQDHSPDMSSSIESSESEPKLRKTDPKKGSKGDNKKELSMSSSSETSGSKSKSKSWKTVFGKGHKHGNKKAPKSSSSESSGSESKSKSKLKETVPTKGHKGGKEKEPKSSSSESSGSESKSKIKSKEIISTKGHKGDDKKEAKNSSGASSGYGSNSKPKSLEIVPITGYKSGNKKEPSVSSSSESSGSNSKSKKAVPAKDHKKDTKKEPKMSSSSESSGSKSRKTVPTKNHKSETKKEQKIKQVGRLTKLKDKLAIIFHNHHHHHHHHHHHPDDKDHQQDPDNKDHHKHPDDKDHHHHSDEKDHHKHSDDKDHHKHPDDKDHHHHSDNKDHHRKSIWQKAGKAFAHKKRKDEDYAEQAVNKVHSKAIVVHKLEDKKQKGHLKSLAGGMGGLIKHASHSKKSKKSKSVLTKIPSRKNGKSGGGKVGKKMQWWDMLRRQRKIKRIEKLRGKIAK